MMADRMTRMMKKHDASSPRPLAGEGQGEGGWKSKRHALSSKAKALRQNQTEAEKIIWHALKAGRFEGLKFRRQFSVGSYIADFACPAARLIIEIDGGQHCENADDEMRTAFLQREGFEVIRFWNNDVMDNLDGLLTTLSLALSRQRERGLLKDD